MVQEIIQYPTPPSVEYGTDVRSFNRDVFTILDDLRDTIEANNLKALAAFQIGSYYNMVVFKEEDGSFVELINPRLISTKGKITTLETTSYFPNLSANITRHDQISIIYQDREANNHTLSVSGEKSVVLQRKFDYNYGATFLSKMSKEEKKQFEKKLEFGSDVSISETCPTTFKRDYITKTFKIILLVMFVVMIAALFISDRETLSNIWIWQLGLSLVAGVINIGYFFYAHYEAKKYTSCVSCQSGNIIGTTLIGFVKITVLMGISYFIL